MIINGRTQARVDEALQQMRAAFPRATITGIAADLATVEGANALIAHAPDADILVNNVGTAFLRDYHGIADIAAIPDKGAVKLTRFWFAAPISAFWSIELTLD